MTYLDYLKMLIDRYALLALHSERIDDTLTEWYLAYADALSVETVREEGVA